MGRKVMPMNKNHGDCEGVDLHHTWMKLSPGMRSYCIPVHILLERTLPLLHAFGTESDSFLRLSVYLFRHLTESYEYKMNKEFNVMIKAIAPLNNPITVSLVFTPKIIPIKNIAIKIKSNANKNPLIIIISPFRNPYTSKHGE